MPLCPWPRRLRRRLVVLTSSGVAGTPDGGPTPATSPLSAPCAPCCCCDTSSGVISCRSTVSACHEWPASRSSRYACRSTANRACTRRWGDANGMRGTRSSASCHLPLLTCSRNCAMSRPSRRWPLSAASAFAAPVYPSSCSDCSMSRTRSVRNTDEPSTPVASTASANAGRAAASLILMDPRPVPERPPPVLTAPASAAIAAVPSVPAPAPADERASNSGDVGVPGRRTPLPAVDGAVVAAVPLTGAAGAAREPR